MAHASIMTFNDPNGSIRVKTDNGKVYIYWQVGTYLALSQAEALQVRDDLSRAITEAAQKAAQKAARAVVEGAE